MQERVIKIPWKVADAFINDRANHIEKKMLRDALREGKVLPKGHHELIDRCDLMGAYQCSNNIFEALQKTDVIVEADEEK